MIVDDCSIMQLIICDMLGAAKTSDLTQCLIIAGHHPSLSLSQTTLLLDVSRKI